MSAKPSVQPMFTQYYDGILGGHLFRWMDKAKYQVISNQLAGVPDAAEVLDLGCGAGAISGRLARLCPQLSFTGADNDDVLLAKAELQGLRTTRVDFDKPLPFADERYDVVLMIDSIEHVASRHAVLSEVFRILKVDGTFIVFTPPYDTLLWLLGEKMHRLLTKRMAGHISPFTMESLSWSLDQWFNSRHVRYLNMGLTLCGIGMQKRRKAHAALQA